MIWKLWIAEAAEVEEANCYSRSENAGKCCWRRMDVRRKGFIEIEVDLNAELGYAMF